MGHASPQGDDSKAEERTGTGAPSTRVSPGTRLS